MSLETANQRKRHPRVRGLPASLPANSASRLRGPLTAHPCAEIGRARILRAPALRAAISCACSPRPRGNPEEQSAAVPAAEAPDISDTSVSSSFVLALALRVPSKAAAEGGRTSRVPRTRAARGIAPISTTGHGWPVGETRSPVANPRLQARARIRRRVLFGYFLLHEQEKVTRPPGRRTRPHRDVSRSSQSAEDQKTKEQSQNGFRLPPE